MKSTTVLSYAAACAVTAMLGQARAEWLAAPTDGLYTNTANWNGGLINNQFTVDSAVTAITVGTNQSVLSGTAGVLNGPFTISAPASSFTFSGGVFSAGSGAVFSVTSAATAATQTINSDIYQGSRTTAASKAFTANAPVATSKFIINGNYNYQTVAASGVTVGGISEVITLNGTGYGVYNGIIANGNAAANGATVAGNVYVARNGGTWEMNGANTFTGGVEFQNNNGSTTILGNKSALGTGALRLAMGFTGYTIRSNTDLSGANAIPNTINYTSRYGANTTTNATLAFTNGSNTATLTGGTTPAVGDVITQGGGLSFLPLYTRVTAVSGSTITLSTNAVATGTSSATTTAPVNVDGGGGTLAITGTTNLDFSGTQNLTTTYSTGAAATQIFAVSNTGTTTFSGVLQQQGGVASVNKTLTGTLVLTAANTYTGSTIINNGGGTLYLGSGVATFGAPTAGAYPTVSVGNGANVGARTSASLSIPNAISGPGKFLQSGTGTTTLTGNNTYTGGTTVSAGTLALGDGGTFGTAGVAVTAATAGVAFANTLPLAVANVISGNGSVSQTGTGTTTITGANTYTGATNVTGGTLKANSAAYGVMLSGAGGVNLGNTGGKLLLDYTATTSPIGQVQSILTAGSPAFATGQIRSTTLTAGHTIGYGDNGTDTVTVRVTLPGDADLDGDVDFNDFLALQSNFNATGTRFDQGNFNYDGGTDFNDFLALQSNFGQSIGFDTPIITAAEYKAVMSITAANQVPEPAALAVLGFGAVALLRRRRAN